MSTVFVFIVVSLFVCCFVLLFCLGGFGGRGELLAYIDTVLLIPLLIIIIIIVIIFTIIIM